MRKHTFSLIFAVSIAFVSAGCLNIAQNTVDTCKEKHIIKTDYVPLHQTAYISSYDELVSESNNMLTQKRYPFCYIAEQDGIIVFYCTSNKAKRALIRLTSSTQSYISELYRIDRDKKTSFVTMITEDITGSNRCIVVPSDNTTMYSSDLFFLDDILQLNDILLNQDYSSIQFNYTKDGSPNHNYSLDIELQERKDVLILE